MDCFTRPTTEAFWLGIVLIGGAVVASLPQWIAIVRRKSSRGLSVEYLTLGLLSASLTGSNSVLLNWDRVECCVTASLSFGDCLSNNLSVLQLITNFTVFAILVALFLCYCVEDVDFPLSQVQKTRSWTKNLLIGTGFALCVLAGSCATLYYKFEVESKSIAAFAEALGYAGAVALVLQYLPQITTTLRLKDAGSLSALGLLIILPGQIMTVMFQGVLNHQPLSTWLPNVFAFCEILFLLILIAIFWLARKRRGLDGFSPDDRERRKLEGWDLRGINQDLFYGTFFNDIG